MSTETSRPRGFSLVENLVALAIVSAVLLVGMTVVLQERRIGRRLIAQRAAIEAIEATLEALRAGALPLENNILPSPWPAPPGSEVPGMVLLVEVEPELLDNLFKLRVEASYEQFGKQESQAIETLHWRRR